MNLKELAKRLSLSQTTVSRALNGYPEVSEATRQKVRAAAEKHGYRPSHHAKRLAGGASHSIGHIIPAVEQQIIDPHFSDFIAGAAEVYGENGYDLSLTLAPKDKEISVYQEYIHTRKVDGFVLQAPYAKDSRLELLRDSGLPFIVHGRCDEQVQNYHFMDVNNWHAFHRATNYLLDLGHRRIALINGLESMNFAKRRKAGFIAAMTGRGCTVPPDWCFSASMVEPYGYEVTQKLLSQPPTLRPTALLAASMLPALGAHRAVVESGLSMPDDISMLVYDDCLSFLRSHTPGNVPLFTSVRSSIYEHGKQVAKQIIAQIQQPDGQKKPVQTIWEAELVLGRSTAPVSRR